MRPEIWLKKEKDLTKGEFTVIWKEGGRKFLCEFTGEKSSGRD